MELAKYILGRSIFPRRADRPSAIDGEMAAAHEIDGRSEFAVGILGCEVGLILQEGNDLVVRHIGPIAAEQLPLNGVRPREKEDLEAGLNQPESNIPVFGAPTAEVFIEKKTPLSFDAEVAADTCRPFPLATDPFLLVRRLRRRTLDRRSPVLRPDATRRQFSDKLRVA